MQSFRCYFLDNRDRIGDAAMIEAEDLAQAVHRGRILLAADRRARFHGIEIWQGTQRLYTDAVLCDAESLA